MFTVKSPNQVRELIEEHFSVAQIHGETVDLMESLGRICAQDICATEDVPGFDRSMVDGYAVRAKDTFGASENLPAMLKKTGEIFMGQNPPGKIGDGECMAIPTGGEFPPGSDCAVMVEYTEDLGDGYIYVQKPSAPGAHMIYKGDDVKKGDVVIHAGSVIRPQDIGALAALGITKLDVVKPIRVGVISTGDELVSVDQPVQGAQIRDVNTWLMGAGVLAQGAHWTSYGIVKDDYETLKAAVKRAAEECDMVLISGGSSVGAKDATHRVVDELGSGVFVHGIAIKPGKPTIIGSIHQKPVFGLPGHPVSAYFIFRLFVCPLIDLLMGKKREIAGYVQAELRFSLPSNHGREEYVPVSLEGQEGQYYAQAVQSKSGLIASLSRADGYVKIERGQEGLMKGQMVTVSLF